MNIYYIVQGKKEEIEWILKLFEELYLEIGEEGWNSSPLNDSLIGETLDSGNTEIYVAKLSDNTIVGIILLEESQSINEKERSGIISKIYVKPAFRSMSIGTKLIEKVKQVAKKKSLKRIVISALDSKRCKKTVLFIENCGFILTDEKLNYTLQL